MANPITPTALNPANVPQSRSVSFVSIGSTAPESTSQSRKIRMPVASALSPARAGALRFWRRPIGRPRKIVPPAIAPKINTCPVLIV